MNKILVAKRQLARIPVMYEQLLRMHPDGMPSLGMVARWDRVGGSSGSVSSITETTAMKNLTLSDTQKEMIRWMDAVYAVFFRLMDSKGKNGPKSMHDKMLAAVLSSRVFDGLSFEKIRDAHFRHQISPQYVQKLYEKTVEMVAQEAEGRGLYKAYEGA